ncbi:MAG: SIS domain-containing protein, partial [Clostridia bacterium]|nr:SIS domain-containing protein [Clostridia bacterium]
AKYFQQMLNVPAEAVVASEFVYNDIVFDEKTLFLLISQSGETADTIKALNIIKEKNSFSIAVTNVVYSSLAQKAKAVIDIFAGPEIAVASTKAYVCMLSALYLLAMQIKGHILRGYDEIEVVANKILDFDFDRIEGLAKTLKNENFVVMLGKNFDYVTALEASLKLKEIAYIYTMALPSGELKHGYLALVENGTQIINFATQKDIMSKNINSGLEAGSRGGVVTLVSPWAESSQIKLNEVNYFLMPIVSIVPMQYLAYRVSVLKNLSPDKPRNLAKSVTVE